MKVLQAIWSLAPERGGPTRSTIGLARALATNGVDVVLMSNQPGVWAKSDERLKVYEGHGVQYRVALKDWLDVINVERPDIVHIQGLWKMGTHAACVAASKYGIPIVISPRGMLDPWALSVKRWKKRLGMALYQRHDLNCASAFHATSEAEALHIRNAIRSDANVFVIPNGVSFPDNLQHREIVKGGMRNALFLSRLHPGKGLLLLADAWAKLRPAGWQMVVVGPDNYGHKAEVIARLRTLGIEDSWVFRGELDDVQKWEEYASADLFIHPSASENFGISIAESLAAGVPVITTKGCPWSEISGVCGWWIERNENSLANAMKEAMEMSAERRKEMGGVARNLILRKYTWDAIGRQMCGAYSGVLAGMSR